MPVNPVSGSVELPVIHAQAEFDGALDNARAAVPSSDELPEGFDDALISGAITVGGQMIMMPRANDILGEAMSDE